MAATGTKRTDARGVPALSAATNIFVLADEAHRTQYGGLAANMRKALPNACFFGFTGTPIDKKDRSTLQTFGPLHRHVHHRAGGRRRRHGADLLREPAARAAHHRQHARRGLRPRLRRPHRGRARGHQEEVRDRGGHRRSAQAHRGHLPRPHRALHEVHPAERLQGAGRGVSAARRRSSTRRRSTD